MNVGMNADWARFKKLGIERLGRPGFAEWLEHAAKVVRVEAQREASNAEYAVQERRQQIRVVEVV